MQNSLFKYYCILIPTWVIILLIAQPFSSFAQINDEEGKGKMEFSPGGDAAQRSLLQLKDKFERAPFDKTAYNDYLNKLIEEKMFEKADSIVLYMMQIRRGDGLLWLDRARIAEAGGRKKEAKTYYDEALEKMPGNEFQIKQLAQKFEDAGQTEHAIQTYLKARELANNPWDFATELASLYNKAGDYKGAINALLDKAMTQPRIQEELQESLSEIIAKEKKGLKEIQKNLNDRILKTPGYPIWYEILSWTYMQNNDYEGAFNNLIELDKKFEENGARLLLFASNAINARRYDYADKALDYILKQGYNNSTYQTAFAGKLYSGLQQLENSFPPDMKKAAVLTEEYKKFFSLYPEQKNSEHWREYAKVEARYNNRPDSAIALLQEVLPRSSANINELYGWMKLDMADYYLIIGKIWDATLLYSQVNKAFEQDELGEQARFKNAKWAFYKGDFGLAQEQLTVLKASTSRLMSNDALYLSVLITENTPPDSNMVPLECFAAADLLLFQHQTKAADDLLDSISKAWPKTPLQDDIAMLRAQTAVEEKNWDKAIKYFKIVLENYGEDVLGDDAAWQLAELYRTQLKDNESAAQYYKTLLLQYPGSTFAQDARKYFREVQNVPKSSKKSS